MNVHIVDTTLRDGEQRAGIAILPEDKIKIAKILDDRMHICQIEAGVPAMGGQEQRTVAKIAQLGLKAHISAWNRLKKDDIACSIACGVDIVHVCVPVSDILIEHKLLKTRAWVKENMMDCLDYALSKNVRVTIGLEDASRADIRFLMEMIELSKSYGISRIRYADTVGVLVRARIQNEIACLRACFTDMEFEIHAHNDFGMAVSNAVASVMAGANYVNCTIGGIGERAGNCNYQHFVQTAGEYFDGFEKVDLETLAVKEKQILDLIYRRKT